MGKYVQEPPFSIQVEFTEGCNLQCEFCGINGIREGPGGPYKFMTEKTANAVARRIQDAEWTSRIEFAMHGEPTMNPNFVSLVSIFRRYLPKNQLMMTSNGAGLLKDTAKVVRKLFDAGLNVLALDDYDEVQIVPRVRARIGSEHVFDYPGDGLVHSPHRRWPRGTQVVLILQDLRRASEGSHAQVSNHCGCAAPLDGRKKGQRCAKPFREMAVRWDGWVAGCCNDWRGVYKVANLAESKGAAGVWQHPRFISMRRKLYYGQRDFGACDGCDYWTHRNGFLPDKQGKASLPRPTREDLSVINEAVHGKLLTIAVSRPWETSRG